jgi:hypothetical protein
LGTFILWSCVAGAAALAVWKFVLEPRRVAREWKEEGERVYLATARRLARRPAGAGAQPPER